MNTQNYHPALELPISIVILAGGRGERIGQDKATLLLEGVPLIQRAVSTALQLSDDVICVARADQDITVEGAAVVRDPPGNRGVLPAILVGLEHVRNDWVFLMACDMPFIQLPLVRYMLSLRQEYTIVVPKLSVGLEPFHALYHHKVVPALYTAIAQDKRRVISFYTGQNIREVNENEIKLYDPHLISFFNINTEDDFIRAQRWA